MKAIVAERGQITIPKILRQKLGIKPGTVLDLQIHQAVLIVAKAAQSDVIEQVYGCLKQKTNTDQLMDSLRGKE